MAKRKGPSWFKLFIHSKAIVDAVPDQDAGQAIKAIFSYFESGEIPDMTQSAFLVFVSIKPYVDEALADYEARVERGKQSQSK